jgi:type I restriction enzyme, S subunit
LIVDGQLPVSWVKSTISDVCSVNPTVDKSKYADNLLVSFVPMPAVEAETGRIDVSEAKEFQSVKKGYTPFQKDDVLFAKITPCMENGKMAVVPEVINNIAFGSTEFQVLRAFTGVLPNFIYYFVSSKMFRQDAEHNMSGAVGQRRVPKPYLEQSDIPIPPTQEQHRIVAKIEELFSEIDKGVENLKTAKAQLQVYRQALLKHAFEGKLTAQWRSDNPDKVLPAAELLRSIEQAREERYQQQLTDWQTAVEKWEFNGKEGKKPSKPRKIAEYSAITDEEQFNLIDLPKGWVWIRLGGVTWSVKDGPHYSPKYSNHGIPFITGGNVRPHGVDFENVKYITLELHEELSQRCKPEFGDILYTKGGTTGIARVNTYTHNFNVWVHVAVLKIVHSVKPFFLQHALNSPFCYSQSQKYTHGVGNQDLGLTRMVNIFLAICSEDEQAEVINIVESKMSVMLEIEAEIDRSLKKAEMLRQSILKKAFSGQLVPQDPTDEPASELLKRIQAEKADRETATKTKRKSTNLPGQLTVLRDI